MSLWNTIWTPMLLKEREKPFNDKSFIYEFKFDGIRAIVYVNQKSIKVVNRHSVDVTNLFPELDRIRELVNVDTIFDGEIVYMEEGKPSFLKLQHRLFLQDTFKINYQAKHNPVVFIAFDLLYQKKNVYELPLLKRKELLNRYKENDFFIKSKWVEEKGIDLYNYTKKLHLEGIVAKKKDSKYELNTRSSSWIKIKHQKEEEFIIGGYIENKSDFTISLLLGEYHNKNLLFVGKVTLGKKRSLYKEVKKMERRKTSVFSNYNKEAIYIKPKLKCLVAYTERTSNNHLRQPHIL